METLTVALGDRAYPIHIGRALLDRVDLLLPFLRQPRVAIVTNVTVAPLYLQRLAGALRHAGTAVIEIILPDGEKFNAETLFMHPTSGELYLVTKHSAGEPSRVFKFPMPLDPSKQVTLLPVATLPVPEPKDQALTGGALSPDGTALLLRMYNRLVELKLPAGAPFEAIFKQKPVNVPVAAEQQGEAVAWRADGRGYFTASEEAGVKPTLNRVECQP